MQAPFKLAIKCPLSVLFDDMTKNPFSAFFQKAIFTEYPEYLLYICYTKNLFWKPANDCEMATEWKHL